MKKAVVGVLALVAGLSLAQQVDYREAARAAAALARLQTGDLVRRHAAVGAADPQVLGVLLVGQA